MTNRERAVEFFANVQPEDAEWFDDAEDESMAYGALALLQDEAERRGIEKAIAALRDDALRLNCEASRLIETGDARHAIEIAKLAVRESALDNAADRLERKLLSPGVAPAEPQGAAAYYRSNDPCPYCGGYGPSGDWSEGDQLSCDDCGKSVYVASIETCKGRSTFETSEEYEKDDDEPTVSASGGGDAGALGPEMHAIGQPPAALQAAVLAEYRRRYGGQPTAQGMAPKGEQSAPKVATKCPLGWCGLELGDDRVPSIKESSHVVGRKDGRGSPWMVYCSFGCETRAHFRTVFTAALEADRVGAYEYSQHMHDIAVKKVREVAALKAQLDEAAGLLRRWSTKLPERNRFDVVHLGNETDAVLAAYDAGEGHSNG